MSQKSVSQTVSIAICFATNQMTFRLAGTERRPVWAARLPPMTALLTLVANSSARVDVAGTLGILEVNCSAEACTMLPCRFNPEKSQRS